MDCFQDFCLHCDRDSPDGPYCSQRCKLSDLERSTPSSPTRTAAQSERNWSQPTRGYAAPSSTSRSPPSYFMWSQHQDQQHPDERQLTPSSSRTSLSSASSQSVSSGSYSTDAKAQLNDYFSSFDQAKAAKRRSGTR